MKKIVVAIALLTIGTIAKAEPLCTTWSGGVNVCLPLSSLDGAYGYNFNSKVGTGNQALLETAFATIKDKASLTFGGAKSPEEVPSPYVSITYGLRNPVSIADNNPLSWLRPGVYVGKKFDTSEWFYGLKTSVNIF